MRWRRDRGTRHRGLLRGDTPDHNRAGDAQTMPSVPRAFLSENERTFCAFYAATRNPAASFRRAFAEDAQGRERIATLTSSQLGAWVRREVLPRLEIRAEIAFLAASPIEQAKCVLVDSIVMGTSSDRSRAATVLLQHESRERHDGGDSFRRLLAEVGGAGVTVPVAPGQRSVTVPVADLIARPSRTRGRVNPSRTGG